jgi:hypothetical protein
VANEEIVRYVQSCLTQGYNYPQIRQALMQSGYPQQDIDEAFLEARRRSMPQQQSYASQKPQGGKKKALILIALIIILLLIGGLVYYMFFMEKDNGGGGSKTTSTLSKSTTTSKKATTTLKSASTTFRSTSSTLRTTTTTINDDILNEPTDGPIRLFDAMLCTDVTDDFDCYENRDGTYKRNDTVYLSFILYLDAKEMNPGSGIYKIGFIEESLKITYPNGRIETISEEELNLDIPREVPEEGTYKIPAFNVILVKEDDPLGEYMVDITLRDRYSSHKLDIKAKYKVTG